jgi:S-formylglutathione hydrolase
MPHTLLSRWPNVHRGYCVSVQTRGFYESNYLSFSPWKAGFLRDAATEGIALVFPDTSPRGSGAPGEDDSWEFGTGASVDVRRDNLTECLVIGAGFYLNATNPKYSKHFNMYNYVTDELPKIIKSLDLPLVRDVSVMS